MYVKQNIMKKIIFILTITFYLNSNAQIMNTFAGTGTAGFSGDGGVATGAQISNPTAVAFDASGNVYIADYNNNRVRKINTSGVISTFAGTGIGGFSGDGGSAINAKLSLPSGVAVDASGNVYIADHANQRIRKVNTSGIISTVVGTGVAGFGGDGGIAISAQINFPTGVTFDISGNMYISDRNNNRVRKINTSGIISTFAGTGVSGFSGDGGPATNAQLSSPNSAVAFDAAGNVYIADLGNYRVRKVNTLGIISTIAGTGSNGFSGDGGAAINAKLSSVFGVAIDVIGNLYIADFNNQRIRNVNTSGIMSTFAGTGIAGFSGDGGSAINAQLNSPAGVSIDAAGNLYIPDAANQRIRNVTMLNGIEDYTDNDQISIYPNPTIDQFTIKTNTTDKLTVNLYDVNGKHVFNKSINDKSVIDVTTLDEGVYSLIIEMKFRVINKKLVIIR